MGVKCRWNRGWRANHAFTCRRLVGAVVVHDQMDVELRGHALIDGSQELQELATAMTPMQIADDLARSEVQCREQCGRAVAHIIMSAPLCNAKRQRQQRLRSIERLDLRLLIHTQHHCTRGRRQIQTHDVAYLVYEQWVGGQLKCKDQHLM